MKGPAGAALLLVALLMPARAWGAVGQEIAHLYEFIGESGCVFVRNGREHDSVEAREHIRRKYGYVRDRVSTAEEFIEYAATKSTVTGKAYLVRCEGREVPAGEWLRAELDSFRQRHRSIPAGDERSVP